MPLLNWPKYVRMLASGSYPNMHHLKSAPDKNAKRLWSNVHWCAFLCAYLYYISNLYCKWAERINFVCWDTFCFFASIFLVFLLLMFCIIYLDFRSMIELCLLFFSSTYSIKIKIDFSINWINIRLFGSSALVVLIWKTLMINWYESRTTSCVLLIIRQIISNLLFIIIIKAI